MNDNMETRNNRQIKYSKQAKTCLKNTIKTLDLHNFYIFLVNYNIFVSIY